MKPFKSSLLSSAMIPAALLAAGVLSAPVAANPGETPSVQVAANPCAAKNPCYPCAAKILATLVARPIRVVPVAPQPRPSN